MDFVSTSSVRPQIPPALPQPCSGSVSLTSDLISIIFCVYSTVYLLPIIAVIYPCLAPGSSHPPQPLVAFCCKRVPFIHLAETNRTGEKREPSSRAGPPKPENKFKIRSYEKKKERHGSVCIIIAGLRVPHGHRTRPPRMREVHSHQEEVRQGSPRLLTLYQVCHDVVGGEESAPNDKTRDTPCRVLTYPLP